METTAVLKSLLNIIKNLDSVTFCVKREQQVNERRNFDYVADSNYMEIYNEKNNGTSVPRNETRELATSMMYSEWMLETPENIDDWIAVLCPVGKRCCVIIQDNQTRAVNKYGTLVNSFPSSFPYGCHLSNNRASHRKRTVLDCVYNVQLEKYYVLDIIEWMGVPYTDFEAEFRFYFLKSKLDEIPGINEKSNKNAYPFEIAPRMIARHLYPFLFEKHQFFPKKVELDGINFYYPEGLYTPKKSPLVLWLQPFMIPEVLQRPVHDLLGQLHKPPNYMNIFEHVESLKKKVKKFKKKKSCNKMEIDDLVEVEIEKDSAIEDEEMCGN